MATKKGGPGSRGGKVIGHTFTGKPVYASSKNGVIGHTNTNKPIYEGKHASYKNFSSSDHLDAAEHHDVHVDDHSDRGGDYAYERHHAKLKRHHQKMSEWHEKQSNKVHAVEAKQAYTAERARQAQKVKEFFGGGGKGRKATKALIAELAIKKALRARDGVLKGEKSRQLAKSLNQASLVKLAKGYGEDVQSWLNQFEGTKLYARAVGILERELEIEVKRAEAQKKRDEEAKALPKYEDFWRQLDALALEKKKLLLELLKQRGGTKNVKKSHGDEERNMASKNPIADIMKGVSVDEDEDALHKAMNEDADEGDEESVNKADPGDDDAGEDDGDDGSDEVVNKGEDGEENEDDLRAAMEARGISAETIDKAMAEVQKGKKAGKRLAVDQEKEGFSSGKKNRGGKLGGNKSANRPSSGLGGAGRSAANPGNTGNYKSDTEKPEMKKGEAATPQRTGIALGPLMTLEKSTGPAGDEEIARDIASRMGVSYDDIAGRR